MPHQRSRIFEIELFFDVAAMDIHRFGAQVQLCGNLTCALAVADQLKYFEFPVAQFFNG